MAKVLMIVAPSGFRDEEFIVPKEMLERSGHKVTVASTTRARATGVKGMSIQPDMAVYETNPDFFEAIVVVGGPGSPMLSDQKEITNFLFSAHAKGKVIGGICLGVMALARAGVLANKKATIFKDRQAVMLLRNNGATYVTEPVVVDGNVVTSDGPLNAGRFGAALLELLKVK